MGDHPVQEASALERGVRVVPDRPCTALTFPRPRFFKWHSQDLMQVHLMPEPTDSPTTLYRSLHHA